MADVAASRERLEEFRVLCVEGESSPAICLWIREADRSIRENNELAD